MPYGLFPPVQTQPHSLEYAENSDHSGTVPYRSPVNIHTLFRESQLSHTKRQLGEINNGQLLPVLWPGSGFTTLSKNSMANSGISRVAQGIYVRPKESEYIGTVMPSAEDVADAIAKRDKARTVPTGAYALNALGLSQQIPIKVVLLTDGSPREIVVGNRTIKK